VPDYEMTEVDWKKVNTLNEIIDEIFEKYGKSKYQTKLISTFRSAVSKSTLSASKKAIYNKVLIHLFRIENL